MCTVVVLNGIRRDFPVVLATNRDEFFARPSSGAVRLLEQPRTVGGQDLVSHGSWMGVTEQGLFVGVTNQRSWHAPDRSKRSRGEVVINALKLGERHAVADMLRTLDAREFNGFNLLWGDAEELLVGYAREDQREIAIEVVPKGIHVLPNDRLDSPDFPKVQRAMALLDPFVRDEFDVLTEALKRMLADRERPPLEEVPNPQAESPLNRDMLRELSALCIRTALYGTRSSTIVALSPGKVSRYLYADGPPDQAQFADVMGLY